MNVNRREKIYNTLTIKGTAWRRHGTARHGKAPRLSRWRLESSWNVTTTILEFTLLFLPSTHHIPSSTFSGFPHPFFHPTSCILHLTLRPPPVLEDPFPSRPSPWPPSRTPSQPLFKGPCHFIRLSCLKCIGGQRRHGEGKREGEETGRRRATPPGRRSRLDWSLEEILCYFSFPANQTTKTWRHRYQCVVRFTTLFVRSWTVCMCWAFMMGYVRIYSHAPTHIHTYITHTWKGWWDMFECIKVTSIRLSALTWKKKKISQRSRVGELHPEFTADLPLGLTGPLHHQGQHSPLYSFPPCVTPLKSVVRSAGCHFAWLGRWQSNVT